MKTKNPKHLNTRILKKIGERVRLVLKSNGKYMIEYRFSPKKIWESVMITSSIRIALQKKHCLTALIIRDLGLFMFFKDRRVKRMKTKLQNCIN